MEETESFRDFIRKPRFLRQAVDAERIVSHLFQNEAIVFNFLYPTTSPRDS